LGFRVGFRVRVWIIGLASSAAFALASRSAIAVASLNEQPSRAAGCSQFSTGVFFIFSISVSSSFERELVVDCL
jgi:hypothetical protein